jgi:hypothetical protein
VVDLVTGRRASFEHGLRAPRMTAAAWGAAVDALVEQPADVEAGQLLRAVLSEVSPPAEHPRIMNLRVDRGGRVWLALPPDGGSRTWHVHSPDGTHVARVRMRSSLDPLDIFDTHIVAVERDELGVSTLVVYSFNGAAARNRRLITPAGKTACAPRAGIRGRRGCRSADAHAAQRPAARVEEDGALGLPPRQLRPHLAQVDVQRAQRAAADGHHLLLRALAEHEGEAFLEGDVARQTRASRSPIPLG